MNPPDRQPDDPDGGDAVLTAIHPNRPHAFRQYDLTDPATTTQVAMAATTAAHDLHARDVGLQAWAVHRSLDGLRVVTVERWQDRACFQRSGTAGDLSHLRPDTALYGWAGTDGASPTPVGDPVHGVTTIDVFRIRRALIRPVSAFNLRNGRTFNQQPGCVSTTVLRGMGVGRIATYARWRTAEDFYTAFSILNGTEVSSTDDINTWAARRTRGLIRTDYHIYRHVAPLEAAASHRAP